MSKRLSDLIPGMLQSDGTRTTDAKGIAVTGSLQDYLSTITDSSLVRKDFMVSAFGSLQGSGTVRHSWYVENQGQTIAGDGSILRPFKTFAEVNAVVQNGDVVFYAPLGTYNSSTNRSESGEEVKLLKDGMTVVVTNSTVITGEIQVNPFPATSSSFTTRLVNARFAGRLVLIKQNASSLFTMDDCQMFTGGFFDHYGYNTSVGSDTVIVNDMICNTVGDTRPCFSMNENGSFSQACKVFLQGGTFKPGGPLIGGDLSYGPHGDTVIQINTNCDVQLQPGYLLTPNQPLARLALDKRTVFTGTTPNDVRQAVVALSYSSGESSTPVVGSMPGMKFCDANYRYEFMNGMNDTDGTSYVWIRCPKM